jgi:hypothetical protein
MKTIFKVTNESNAKKNTVSIINYTYRFGFSFLTFEILNSSVHQLEENKY